MSLRSLLPSGESSCAMGCLVSPLRNQRSLSGVPSSVAVCSRSTFLRAAGSSITVALSPSKVVMRVIWGVLRLPMILSMYRPSSLLVRSLSISLVCLLIRLRSSLRYRVWSCFLVEAIWAVTRSLHSFHLCLFLVCGVVHVRMRGASVSAVALNSVCSMICLIWC